jgi:hypothetical protein
MIDGAFQQRLREFIVEAKEDSKAEIRIYHDLLQKNFKIEMDCMIDQFNHIRQELYTTEVSLLNARIEN